MALTPSNMMPLGTVASNFKLLDTISNQFIELETIKSEIATVIMFICNHCPFVKHIQKELVKVANEYQNKGIVFIAISANDPDYDSDDSPENMHKVAQQLHYPFPYLFDETQEVAKAYDAACTPDFYIFDKNLKCIYRGQFDDSRPNNSIAVTGKDIRSALDNVLNNMPIDTQQKPSIGCNIKWK